MSVKLGKCRISASFYFFAMLAGFCAFGGSTVIAGLIAAAVHECGHLLAMIAFEKSYPDKVDITPFGLCITYQLGAPGGCWATVSVAGAGGNFIAAGLLLILYTVVRQDFIFTLMCANLCLACINLFPVDPLDGGVFLHLMLEKMFSHERAERISLAVSVIFLIPLTAAGLFLLMRSHGNFSLLMLSLWLMVFVLRKYV